MARYLIRPLAVALLRRPADLRNNATLALFFCTLGSKRVANATHKQTTPLTVSPQVALLGTYLLCGLFNSGQFVVNFVLVACLQAADFWFVKVSVLSPARRAAAFLRVPQNVSGRKLIGLRYWNSTNENGDNLWEFESRDAEGMAALVSEEKRLFWLTLYVMPLVWTLFAFIRLIKFSIGYLLLCLLGLALSSVNVVGFTKSSKEAQAEISSRSAGFLGSALRFGMGGGTAAAR